MEKYMSIAFFLRIIITKSFYRLIMPVIYKITHNYCHLVIFITKALPYGRAFKLNSIEFKMMRVFVIPPFVWPRLLPQFLYCHVCPRCGLWPVEGYCR